MRYCKECGLLVPQGTELCPQCGAIVPPEQPVYTELTAAAEQPPQTGAPLYGASAQPAAQSFNPEGADLSLAGFVVSMMLMEIPLVGGILQLVWACGGTKNPTRRKLATATLIKAAINMLLGLLLLLAVALIGMTAYNSLGSTPMQYYTW